LVVLFLVVLFELRVEELGLAGNGPGAREAAALRDAVLLCHEELVRPAIDRRGGRLWRWLDRLHLSWLTAPWMLVDVVRTVGWGRQPAFFAAHHGAVRLYRELSGKDPGVADAEVWRMTHQLGSLDGRLRDFEADRPSRPPGADRDELEAAAGALAGYHLRGRRTDDDLLEQVEAAWAEVEELETQRDDEAAKGVFRRGRRARRQPGNDQDEREEQAVDRYVVAWRRWLERQAQQGSPAGRGG
jgi:hypothetical protein